MKVMGLDLGSKTLGLALSDINEILASGITTIRFDDEDYKEAISLLKPYVNDNKVKKIVLGLPKHMNGSIGEQGEVSLRFKEMLEDMFDVEVILWDERLTTKVAHSVMISANVSRKKRKKNVDKIAATVILQGYLDKI